MSEYPNQYLLVECSKSGHRWIVPLRSNTKLDLERLVKKWIESEFCGELKLSGEIMSRISGDYYASIKLDGEPPESVRCWDGGGFFIK